MRTPMRHLASVFSIITLLLTGSSLLLVFQNCGSTGTAYNPLINAPAQATCTGVNCSVDITTAGFNSTVSGIILDPQATTSSAAVCDNTTCFDVGGFCELGGFPNSQFVYQWVLGNGTTLAPVTTSSSCDSNGRYRVLIKIPFSNYNWSISNQVKLTMQVLDSAGNVQTNPNGTTSFTYTVTTRTSN